MQSINHVAFIDVKIKRVIGVLGVVRVAPLSFCPADDFTNVLNQLLALGNILQREHALAMHARASDLNSAMVGRAGWFGHGGKFGMVNPDGRVGARSHVHVRAPARTRETGL